MWLPPKPHHCPCWAPHRISGLKPHQHWPSMRSDLSFESAELEAEFSKLQTERNLRLTKQVGRGMRS